MRMLLSAMSTICVIAPAIIVTAQETAPLDFNNANTYQASLQAPQQVRGLQDLVRGNFIANQAVCGAELPTGTIIGTVQVDLGCDHSESKMKEVKDGGWLWSNYSKVRDEFSRSNPNLSIEGATAAAMRACEAFNKTRENEARDGVVVCDLQQMTRLVSHQFSSFRSSDTTLRDSIYQYRSGANNCGRLQVPVLANFTRAGFARTVCYNTAKIHNLLLKSGNGAEQRRACLSTLQELGCIPQSNEELIFGTK